MSDKKHIDDLIKYVREKHGFIPSKRALIMTSIIENDTKHIQELESELTTAQAKIKELKDFNNMLVKDKFGYSPEAQEIIRLKKELKNTNKGVERRVLDHESSLDHFYNSREKALAENKRLRSALEKYADPRSWKGDKWNLVCNPDNFAEKALKTEQEKHDD